MTRLRRAAAVAMTLGALAAAAPAAPPPTPRPTPAPQLAPPPAPGPARRPDQVSALCGDPRLTGTRAAPIDGPGRCGVAAPVALTAIAGARLDAPVTVGCDVARATADWVQTTLRPAARNRLDARLTGLTLWAGYACRPRNNRPGARLSEHGYGRAIDIAAFHMADGETVTVLADWRGGADARAFLRAAWRGACARFRTVLGPDADRHHRNHLHLDVARRDGGAYCR